MFRFTLGNRSLERAAKNQVRREVRKAFDPTWRKTFHAVSCPQESPKYGAPVYVFSAQIRIHDKTLFRFVVVLQSQIKDGSIKTLYISPST